MTTADGSPAAPDRSIRILGVDDDPVSRLLLEATLDKRGHAVTMAADGTTAWELIEKLTRPASPAALPPPLLAILDWFMPVPDGMDLCRRIRECLPDRMVYTILLTSCGGHEAVVAGLEAGAHDYIVKPFHPDELEARVRVGLRVLRLQQSLAERVRDVEAALAQVKQLHGLLPICSYCKSIRRDDNYWQQVEHYIAAHSEAQFSHGICPGCYEKEIQPQLAALRHKVERAGGPSRLDAVPR
jgi:sigma-B regulation protein RsbU (phosphoserine phosphatase)